MRATQNSPADRRQLADLPAASRSRIANGALGIDLRTRTGRRWRDCYLELMAQTGGRHVQMVRSLASLIVQREKLDADLARGEPVDSDELLRLCGAISRLMARVGLVADDEPGEGPDVTAEVIARIGTTEAA